MAEGPEELKDLLFMKTEDFSDHLTKLQARKLISFFEESFSQGKSQTIIEPVLSVSDFSSSLQSTQLVSPPPISTESQNTMHTQKMDESWASKFIIPFDKFPPQIMKMCEEGLRPNPEDRAHLIRILTYEISKISPKPGKKNLEIIARMLVSQYPKSFQDTICDQPFGNGYASFLHSLVLKFDNQNRKRKDSLKMLVTDKKVKNKKLKSCINYQPDTLPDEETEMSQKIKKEYLQNQYQISDNLEVEVAMEKTFASQRLTINSATSVTSIIKEWPFLSQAKYLVRHFELAMQPYSPNWDTIFIKKIPELLDFLKNKVQNCTVPNLDVYDNLYAVLVLLCNYFKEEVDIIKFYRECECSDDLVVQNSPVTPFIAVFGEKAAVIIEKERFSEYLPPSEAFKVWFSSYYVFNLVYPSSCSASMEFIQRGLMEIAPDSSSSKSGLKKSIKLVKDLCNYRSMLWKITN